MSSDVQPEAWTRPGIRGTWSGAVVVSLLLVAPSAAVVALAARHNYGNAVGLFAIFGGWFAAFAWTRRRYTTSFVCSPEGFTARTWYGRTLREPWERVGTPSLTQRRGVAGLRSLRIRSSAGRLLAELPEDIGPLEEIAETVERRRQLATA